MQPPEAARPIFRMTLRWLFLILSIGISAGLSSALFLWSLDIATSTFRRNPQLIYGLPAAAGLIAYIAYYAGAAANQGNNGVIRAIKGDLERVPLLMAPLILITTLLTHLCGGSAGREGTAVQMSGSLADTLLSRFAIPQSERSVYLRAAMAAGFSAVFGTPFAGAVFGMEVSKVRQHLHMQSFVPCLAASIVGDITCRLTGVGHAHYALIDIPKLSPMGFLWLPVCGVTIGLLGIVFIEGQHFLAKLGADNAAAWKLRPIIGGVVILVLTLLLGTNSFNGLGLPLIADALSTLDLCDQACLHGHYPWKRSQRRGSHAIILYRCALRKCVCHGHRSGPKALRGSRVCQPLRRRCQGPAYVLDSRAGALWTETLSHRNSCG